MGSGEELCEAVSTSFPSNRGLVFWSIPFFTLPAVIAPQHESPQRITPSSTQHPVSPKPSTGTPSAPTKPPTPSFPSSFQRGTTPYALSQCPLPPVPPPSLPPHALLPSLPLPATTAQHSSRGPKPSLQHRPPASCPHPHGPAPTPGPPAESPCAVGVETKGCGALHAPERGGRGWWRFLRPRGVLGRSICTYIHVYIPETGLTYIDSFL